MAIKKHTHFDVHTSTHTLISITPRKLCFTHICTHTHTHIIYILELAHFHVPSGIVSIVGVEKIPRVAGERLVFGLFYCYFHFNYLSPTGARHSSASAFEMAKVM